MGQHDSFFPSLTPRIGAGLFLLLLAGCRLAGPEAPATFDQRRKGHPELSMVDMELESYGPRGKEWEMASPIGELYTEKNLMNVSQIKIQMFENGNKSSEINADQGFMATGPLPANALSGFEIPLASEEFQEGDILFSGQVVVVSTDNQKLMTDWLHYKKKVDLIVSSAPVRVERDDSITTGIGLEATSDLANLKIFNQSLVIKDKEGGL